MIVFDIATKLPASITKRDLDQLGRKIGKALRQKSKREICIAFVTEKAITKLNKDYRGINKPTDVLSFEPSDIIICEAYAKREAKRRALSTREELIRLAIHGVLHLSGYDHCTDKEEAEMFSLQERLVNDMMEL
ncbi:rRNA maturation RNase YbeY [Candidatus Uhrbacteria bacterium]|nr:rRNA maturation RNase YbeY [Candidatus Uhrbacteria bacterium]